MDDFARGHFAFRLIIIDYKYFKIVVGTLYKSWPSEQNFVDLAPSEEVFDSDDIGPFSGGRASPPTRWSTHSLQTDNRSIVRACITFSGSAMS